MLSTIFTKLQKLKHIVIFEVSSLFQKYTMLIEKRGIQDSEKKNNFVSQNTTKKNQLQFRCNLLLLQNNCFYRKFDF